MNIVAKNNNPKLTIVKGGRQTGKTQYILTHLEEANVVILPNIMMAKMVLDRYMQNEHNRKICHISKHTASSSIAVARTEYYYDAPKKGKNNLTIFTPAETAYHALESLRQQRFYSKLKVWIDETNMVRIDRLARIVEYCQEANLDLVATFIPTVVTPRTAYNIGWLNLPQWYSNIEYIELPVYTKWGMDFSTKLPLEMYLTEILGEYVLADDPTPQRRLPKGIFA